MICIIKIQSDKMKITWTISLFIFCMIYYFCKCDGYTVLWIIFIKLCLVKFVASACNRGKLTLKLHQKK